MPSNRTLLLLESHRRFHLVTYYNDHVVQMRIGLCNTFELSPLLVVVVVPVCNLKRVCTIPVKGNNSNADL